MTHMIGDFSPAQLGLQLQTLDGQSRALAGVRGHENVGHRRFGILD
jgi:hypothetical protein